MVIAFQLSMPACTNGLPLVGSLMPAMGRSTCLSRPAALVRRGRKVALVREQAGATLPALGAEWIARRCPELVRHAFGYHPTSDSRRTPMQRGSDKHGPRVDEHLA